MSISSLRGQITAFGLYCPLTDLLSSAFGHAAPAVMPGTANSHLQLCCLVDMVLGTGKPAPPLTQAKKATRIGNA